MKHGNSFKVTLGDNAVSYSVFVPPDFLSLLGVALCGETLGADGTAHTPGEVLRWMTAAGWDQETLCRHAWAQWDQKEPWPHPIPPGSLEGISAAQWYATLSAVRTALGVDQVPHPPSKPRDLSQAERRLVQDLPPHHGPSG